MLVGASQVSGGVYDSGSGGGGSGSGGDGDGDATTLSALCCKETVRARYPTVGLLVKSAVMTTTTSATTMMVGSVLPRPPQRVSAVRRSDCSEIARLLAGTSQVGSGGNGGVGDYNGVVVMPQQLQTTRCRWTTVRPRFL